VTNKNVGIIGVGNVGGRMAKDLVDAGYDVLVMDPSEAAAARAVANGARKVSSYAEMMDQTDVVLLSLPNSNVVEAVTRGDSGLLAQMKSGQVLVDMSTSLPTRTAELVKLCESAGIRILDAPISFGPHGMDIMAGGDQALFDEIYPIFEVVGHRTTLVGPNGHGHYTKLIQNMISGVNTAVIAEGMAFGAKVGLDLERVWEAIRTTGAATNQVERSYPRMARREFGQGGQLALHTKDMRYVIETAKEIQAVTPFSEVLLEVFSDSLEKGDKLSSQLASIIYYESRMGISVNDPMLPKNKEGQ
jgi:3-hydroxyisobutyrate dehydrogenase-like beta-hydroxyacid dehydrogenase